MRSIRYAASGWRHGRVSPAAAWPTAAAAFATRSPVPAPPLPAPGSARPVAAPASAATARSSGLASTSGREALEQPEQQGVRSAYVHLPFCKRKCFYCDFPVEAVGRDLTSPRVEGKMKSYVDLVLREIAATRVVGQADGAGPAGPLQTVFFGGGTPSLVPPGLLGAILEALHARFGIAPGAEVSMEADPGTFDAARLREYGRLGVTRLSVGVQAFQQPLLEACGRGHDLRDVYAAVEAVAAAGLPSWSLDLISGLPGLTREHWRHSLREAVAAGPHHVSVYDLQVEEGTPFEVWQRRGRIRLPPDEATVAMYEEASDTLRGAGYEHYEVSNYAKPGHRSAHNQVYWAGRQYHAFGLGAASYLAGRRFSRPARMREYGAWVEGLAAAAARADGAGVMPGHELPAESQEELLLDTVMLRLRTAGGLDLQQLRGRFGAQAEQVVRGALLEHEPLGHVWGLDAQGGRCGVAEARAVRLSDPRGFLMSNDVISDVFAAFDFGEAGVGGKEEAPKGAAAG